MVRYLGVSDLRGLVRRIGLEAMLLELAGYIRADFLRWDEFEKSIRHASHFRAGVIELMPIHDRRYYAFKFVNGHPANTALGKSTVVAFGALADVATGHPLLISELTVATALRTAAVSALAASVLARPESRTMAIIGNGSQSEFQAIAFKALLGVKRIAAYDIDEKATAKLFANLERAGGFESRQARSVEDAVEGADIVTTLTAAKVRAEILHRGMLSPGTHVNAVGGDCPGKTELDPAILAAAKVVVEFEPQARIEGEIQQLDAASPVTELWRILGGHAPGRDDERELTVFDSVGFALEDFSTLRYLLDVGERFQALGGLDIVPPELADPKNLYAVL
jgi:ornithine cyclodeaminase